MRPQVAKMGFSFNGELSENLTMDHSRLRLSSVRLPARYWHLLMISKKITSIVAGTEKNNIRLYHLDIFFSASLKSLTRFEQSSFIVLVLHAIFFTLSVRRQTVNQSVFHSIDIM